MVLVLAFLSLFALNLAVGTVIDAGQSPADPFGDPNASSPVTGLRLGLAAALVLLYPLVVRSRLPDLAKAVLIAAPVGVPTAALLVTLYDRPVLALGCAVAAAIVITIALVASRRPWTWFLAAGWAWILAVYYGVATQKLISSIQLPKLAALRARTRSSCVVHRLTSSYYWDVGEVLDWDEESAGYIRGRGDRYPGGLGIESEWAQQVMDDVALVAFEPDPKSRMGASRLIGFSADAGRVLVVIAFRDADGDLHGINAWPATGADLRFHREGTTDGEDD